MRRPSVWLQDQVGPVRRRRLPLLRQKRTDGEEPHRGHRLPCRDHRRERQDDPGFPGLQDSGLNALESFGIWSYTTGIGRVPIFYRDAGKPGFRGKCDRLRDTFRCVRRTVFSVQRYGKASCTGQCRCVVDRFLPGNLPGTIAPACREGISRRRGGQSLEAAVRQQPGRYGIPRVGHDKAPGLVQFSKDIGWAGHLKDARRAGLSWTDMKTQR